MEKDKGDFITPDQYASESTAMSASADDLLREALEAAFYNWWAENHEALSLGAAGDVLDLRLRLNAASANSLHSSLVCPKAA